MEDEKETPICPDCGGEHDPKETSCCCDAPMNEGRICLTCGEHN